MKISIIVSFVFLFIFNVGLVQADSCDELRPILDKYYKASQDENIDEYMTVIDVNYVRENLLDNYEEYVGSAWEVYDTKSYELSPYNCKMETEDALMYFNMKSTLVSEEGEVELQKNYVALFNNIDGWKIKYVVDEEVFSQFQDALTSQLYLDATKDMIYAELDKADEVIAYEKLVEEIESGEYSDTVSEGVEKREITKTEDSGGSKLMYLLLFISIPIMIFIFAKNKIKK